MKIEVKTGCYARSGMCERALALLSEMAGYHTVSEERCVIDSDAFRRWLGAFRRWSGAFRCYSK